MAPISDQPHHSHSQRPKNVEANQRWAHRCAWHWHWHWQYSSSFPPVASEASRAPARQRQRHTDGRAAWNGRGLVSAAPPGASAGWSPASNLAPRLLNSTTTPSSAGPPMLCRGHIIPTIKTIKVGYIPMPRPVVAPAPLTGCCLFVHCAHFFYNG